MGDQVALAIAAHQLPFVPAYFSGHHREDVLDAPGALVPDDRPMCFRMRMLSLEKDPSAFGVGLDFLLGKNRHGA